MCNPKNAPGTKIPKRKSQGLRFNHLFLLLLVLACEGTSDGAEAEAVEQPVEAQRAQQAVDDAAETETAEQATHDAEHTAEQQADGGDDLEERLAQEAPQGVELLLGVGHVLELALGAVDGFGDGASELLSVSQ